MINFAGIDDSSNNHSIKIIDQNQEILEDFDFENNNDGFQKLHGKLSNYSQILVGLEMSHGPLVDFLRKNQYNIYSLNPLKIRRFKESHCVSGDKTDKIDCGAIAHYMLNNHKTLRPMQFSSQVIEELKIHGISHDRLTKEHTRYTNKLLFIIRQYLPLYEFLFSEISSKILLKLLISYPKWDDLRALSTEEFVGFLKKNYYRNNKYINKVINKINKYIHNVSPEVENALAIEAQCIARVLLMIKDELHNLEAKMKSITDSHRLGAIFKSLPGAGDLLAGKLLGVFGDNKDKYDSAAGMQALFGTAPINYQSGNYHKVIIRRACNKRARAILYKFAFSTLQYSEWSRSYYDGQREKGKTHSVAVRALSNKWVRIIYKLWKDELIYSAEEKNYQAA